MKEISIIVETQVEFSDVDMALWTWHGSYCRYFEKAREALLDKIGYGCKVSMSSGIYWPIVEYKSTFKQATYYQQQLKIKAAIIEYEHRLKIKYDIYDKNTNKRVTSGYTIQVPVDYKSKKLYNKMPDCFLQCIKEAHHD